MAAILKIRKKFHCFEYNLYLYLRSAFIYNKLLQTVYVETLQIVVTVTFNFYNFITQQKFHTSPTFNFVLQY